MYLHHKLFAKSDHTFCCLFLGFSALKYVFQSIKICSISLIFKTSRLNNLKNEKHKKPNKTVETGM